MASSPSATDPGPGRFELVAAHVLAGTAALAFAFLVFRSSLMTSAVQFVAPALVMMLVHLGWQGVGRGLRPGFSITVMLHTAVTAILVLLGTLGAALLVPMPASASAEGFGLSIIMLLYCLVIVAVVGAAIGLTGFLIVMIIRLAIRAIKGPKPPEGPAGSRLFDIGATAATILALSAASFEGVTPALRLDPAGSAFQSFVVEAPPSDVWAAVGRATSPRFALPALLRSVPQPVSVLVDEGAELGDRRIVRFRGREGEGDLVLQVVKRTDTEAVFAAISDTSPIAMWVKHRTLTFRVEPDPAGARLTVTLDYERNLAPAWFFRPYVKLGAFLAVDVLARDTRDRAEGG